jgi:hypothetical protein
VIDSALVGLIIAFFCFWEGPFRWIEGFRVRFPNGIGEFEVLHCGRIKNNCVFIAMLGIKVEECIAGNGALKVGLPDAILKLNDGVSHHERNCSIHFYFHLVLQ